jgi:hypothetical protein
VDKDGGNNLLVVSAALGHCLIAGYLGIAATYRPKWRSKYVKLRQIELLVDAMVKETPCKVVVVASAKC